MPWIKVPWDTLLSRLGCFCIKGFYLPFNQSHIPEVNAALYSARDNPEVQNVDSFILETLFAVVDSYIPISRGITKKRNYLDKTLNKKPKIVIWFHCLIYNRH